MPEIVSTEISRVKSKLGVFKELDERDKEHIVATYHMSKGLRGMRVIFVTEDKVMINNKEKISKEIVPVEILSPEDFVAQVFKKYESYDEINKIFEKEYKRWFS